jgi:hypothetical protein
MHYLTPFAFDPDQTATECPGAKPAVCKAPPAPVREWAKRWGLTEKAAGNRLRRLALRGGACRVAIVGLAYRWEVRV